jgi:hypothetical protein
MSRTSQWLFEAPFILESDRYSDRYANLEFEDEEEEWGDKDQDPTGLNNFSDVDANIEIILAIQQGFGNQNRLTDMIFRCRFPDARLKRNDPRWIKVRDDLVRPFLKDKRVKSRRNALDSSVRADIEQAIKNGNRDEKDLTDIGYTVYANPSKLKAEDPCQAFRRKEWLRIRDRFVRPALKKVMPARGKVRSPESDRDTNPYFNSALEYEWENPRQWLFEAPFVLERDSTTSLDG